MKSLLLTALVFTAGFTAYSQEPATLQEATQAEPTVQNTETSTKPKYDRTDPYLGKGEAIKSVMVSGEIPEDFPKYEEWMTLEDYQQQLSVWLKTNKELIKGEDLERVRSAFNKSL